MRHLVNLPIVCAPSDFVRPIDAIPGYADHGNDSNLFSPFLLLFCIPLLIIQLCIAHSRVYRINIFCVLACGVQSNVARSDGRYLASARNGPLIGVKVERRHGFNESDNKERRGGGNFFPLQIPAIVAFAFLSSHKFMAVGRLETPKNRVQNGARSISLQISLVHTAISQTKRMQ